MIDKENTSNNFNFKAFFGGIAFIISLYFIGSYISGSITSIDLNQPNTLLWTTIVIALSTGHYIGLSFTKKGGGVNSFLIGVFLSLTVATVYITYIIPLSNLTGILISLTIAVFLMHSSNIISNHEKINNLIRFFAEKVSIPTFTAGSGFNILEWLVVDLGIEYSHRSYENQTCRR